MLRLVMRCCGFLLGTSGPVVRHTVGKQLNPGSVPVCLWHTHTTAGPGESLLFPRLHFPPSGWNLASPPPPPHPPKWDGTLHDCKLQALDCDILSSATAVFSYAIGSRKLSANEQFFCWCSNSSKFVTNNSNKTRRINKVYTSTNKTTIV